MCPLDRRHLLRSSTRSSQCHLHGDGHDWGEYAILEFLAPYFTTKYSPDPDPDHMQSYLAPIGAGLMADKGNWRQRMWVTFGLEVGALVYIIFGYEESKYILVSDPQSQPQEISTQTTYVILLRSRMTRRAVHLWVRRLPLSRSMHQ